MGGRILHHPDEDLSNFDNFRRIERKINFIIQEENLSRTQRNGTSG